MRNEFSYNPPLKSSKILWQVPRIKTIELAAAGCVETGSPKGFPETRKPQASVETRGRSPRLKLREQSDH